LEKKGVCPRCGAQGADVGPAIINIGRTRGIKLSAYNCPKCNLVYFEKLIE
jgi:ssDNA-binding Zn-finger/Zn-ribbon topoisomerase 1